MCPVNGIVVDQSDFAVFNKRDARVSIVTVNAFGIMGDIPMLAPRFAAVAGDGRCYGSADSAARIDGEWNLHRISNHQAEVFWKLYNLTADPAEETDLAETESLRVHQMHGRLESVVQSLNGEDYAEI